jgi:hypothetical protein
MPGMPGNVRDEEELRAVERSERALVALPHRASPSGQTPSLAGVRLQCEARVSGHDACNLPNRSAEDGASPEERRLWFDDSCFGLPGQSERRGTRKRRMDEGSPQMVR